MHTACVVGLGRVGLPTAVAIAKAGHRVLGVDVDPARRAAVRAAVVGPEPGLAAAVSALIADAQLDVAASLQPADTYLVCVPTPLGPSGTADLRAVHLVLTAVARVAPPQALILLCSTVPVGTTASLERAIRRPVVYSPERVLPGRALHETIHNERLVGGCDPDSTEAAARWWEGVVAGRVHRTDARTAELVKLVENATRDAEIAIANSVARLARAYDVDEHEVIGLANRHPRVRLRVPGIGVGGHCLPVDPWFAIAGAREEGRLFEVCRQVNDGMVDDAVSRVRDVDAVQPLALLGLAYKPDTDDLRHAPALRLARRLAEERPVVVHDPYAVVPDDLDGVSLEAALTQPIVVAAVAHRTYRDVRPAVGCMAVDLCGVWQGTVSPNMGDLPR